MIVFFFNILVKIAWKRFFSNQIMGKQLVDYSFTELLVSYSDQSKSTAIAFERKQLLSVFNQFPRVFET